MIICHQKQCPNYLILVEITCRSEFENERWKCEDKTTWTSNQFFHANTNNFVDLNMKYKITWGWRYETSYLFLAPYPNYHPFSLIISRYEHENVREKQKMRDIGSTCVCNKRDSCLLLSMA
jgi:hypothetical protein